MNDLPTRKPTTITCGGCTERWTAQSWAHCSGCHRTFAGIGLFDRHRTADSQCQDPASVRDGNGKPVFEYRDGAWRGPEMPPEVLAKLRQLWAVAQ